MQLLIKYRSLFIISVSTLIVVSLLLFNCLWNKSDDTFDDIKTTLLDNGYTYFNIDKDDSGFLEYYIGNNIVSIIELDDYFFYVAECKNNYGAEEVFEYLEKAILSSNYKTRKYGNCVIYWNEVRFNDFVESEF